MDISENILMPPWKIKQEYRRRLQIVNYYAKIRARILSRAFPLYIIVKPDGVEYKYSEEVEELIKKINEMEESELNH